MADKKQNPFPYNTDPELNYIFDKLVDLQTRVTAQFAKAEKLAGFTDDAKFRLVLDAKLDLPNYRILREPNRGGWYTSVTPLDKIDEKVQEAICVAKAHLDEVEAINKPIMEHNQQVSQQVTEIMTRLGVPTTYTTYDYPTSRSRTKKSTSHTAGYYNDLIRVQPRSNVSALRSQLNSYLSEYERWKKNVYEEELKLKIEKDEETVKTKILGNPHLVQTLMQADVNILSEVQNAVPGKKSDVIDYCIVRAISNLKGSATYDQKLMDSLVALKQHV